MHFDVHLLTAIDYSLRLEAIDSDVESDEGKMVNDVVAVHINPLSSVAVTCTE